MSWFLPILVFSIAAAATWILCFPVIDFLRKRQVIDQPNERSSHRVPTPRGGGIAIVLVFGAGLLVLGQAGESRAPSLVAACIGLLAAISFMDDLRPLPPFLRFCIHTAAAVFLLVGLQWASDPSMAFHGGRADAAQPTGAIGRAAVFVLLCVYLVGYTNGFNFMDGINGIAAMQTLVTSLGIAAMASQVSPAGESSIAFASLLLAGAALGFLPHNFPKERVFMGDVGSIPIGFACAALGIALACAHGLWLMAPIAMLHMNYILDTSITLGRRVLRGEKWYLPHREHFYQRLVRSGRSHAFVTGWELVLQLLTLGLAIAYLHVSFGSQVLIGATVLVLWLCFFAWAEVCFRASQREPADGVAALVPERRN